MEGWLKNILACPRDHLSVQVEAGRLVCESGHRYPIIEGVPVMLLEQVKQTHEVATISLEKALSTRAVEGIGDALVPPGGVDEFVQHDIAATNGLAYRSLIGRLKEYPIPELRVPPSVGSYLLDIGCNWGRWCIAAAKLGYRPVGIDPNLEAVLAACRVARQLGVEAHYLVADARYLPFAEQAFDVAFSYSVLQHFAKSDVWLSLYEIRRVLKVGAVSMVQMPNMFGFRCVYHQVRRGFREGKDFEVRYWMPSELRATFSRSIGPTTVTVDGFLSLNAQSREAHLLPWRYRAVVYVSDMLRRLSKTLPIVTYMADSVYVTSTRSR